MIPKLNENSLFAILLRSSWWVSFAVAGTVIAIAVTLLPEAYRLFGVVTGLPFVVIGSMAARTSFQAPSAARVQRTLDAVRAMSRTEFSRALEAAYRGAGYGVHAIDQAAADFAITKDGRTTLVSCRHWKVAQTGIERLAELHAAKEARDAHECVYITTGAITDNARAFARKHAVKLAGGPELAQLLPGKGRGKNA